MSIAKLTAILVSIDERLSNLEKSGKSTESKVRDIAGSVGTPTGELQFKAMLRPSVLDLKKAMQDKAVMQLECVEMEATFSHALYMGIAPESREQIRKLLAPQQINYLVSVLENHKKLNALAGWAEDFMKKATQNLEDRKVEIQKAVERAILGGNNSVVERLRISEERLRLQEDKIDIALRNLKKAESEAKASLAKADNIITAGQRTSRKDYSRGATE